VKGWGGKRAFQAPSLKPVLSRRVRRRELRDHFEDQKYQGRPKMPKSLSRVEKVTAQGVVQGRQQKRKGERSQKVCLTVQS